MKAILLVLLFTALSGKTCKEKKEARDREMSTSMTLGAESIDKTPACIRTKIDSIKKQQRYNPPAEVNEYRYHDKRVFLFTSDCCDNFNSLLDENCKYVCAPTGGFSGKGDFTCTDFTEKAKWVKLIWKDDRK